MCYIKQLTEDARTLDMSTAKTGSFALFDERDRILLAAESLDDLRAMGMGVFVDRFNTEN